MKKRIMAMILKCKMCGGDIEVNESMSVGTCLYCGSTMTLPRIDSEKKARLFNRANQYRMNCEFDKAYDAYKMIVEEDEQEAEAYWGLILSEYGVEYVEDPKTKKRVPTCHRTHIQSITASMNFQLACQYADAENRMMYQDEAEILDALQKRIISVSAKEEPYDVFICYKESDANGERTEDSVLAHEIYEELTKHGIRTFFARISLEDKLGQDYEPFIYSALTTSKVMLMVTMNGEHCNAVWVKNEWMRFLHFMEDDADKKLIPVYKNISPYELPNEFVKLQAQDMGKVGAIQDLVYGVQKILGKVTRNEGSGMKAEERALLKSLEEDNIRRQKSSVRNQKLVLSVVFWVGIIFITVIFLAVDLWMIGTMRVDFSKLLTVFPEVFKISMPFIGLGVLSELIAYILNLKKGIREKKCGIFYVVGAVLITIGCVIVSLFGLEPKTDLLVIYILNLGFVIAMALLSFSDNKKKVTAIGILVIALIGFIITPSVIPDVASGSNERDSSVQQLMVTNEYINIREEPDQDAKHLGRVYEDEIYTIYSVVETEKQYWYEIKTDTGIHGYIVSYKFEEYVELLDVY